jgi:CheY-like chemotaxis protein
MNTPLPALPFSASLDAPKKKRVLLIDRSHGKRDLRTEALRKFGMDVDSAVDIVEARAWWRPALYDLVLINMAKGRGQHDEFCDDLHRATPPQRLTFLVGQPEYLADWPNADPGLLMESSVGQAFIARVKSTRPADPGDTTEGRDMLEVSRRMAAVRSASVARTERCAPCLLRHKILKEDHLKQLRHRPA